MGKMLKYEFKSTWKFMLLVLLCALGIAAGAYVAVGLNTETLLPLTTDAGQVVAYVSQGWVYGVGISAFLFVATIVLSVCFGVVRFKKVLTVEEGYFVNTLPVGTGSIIWSKAIMFFLFSAVLVGVTFIAFFNLMLNGEGGLAEGRLIGEIAFSKDMFEVSLEAVGGLLASIASGFAMIFQLYAAMAIGFSYSKHKGLLSLGMLVGISIIMELASELLTPIRNRIYNTVPMQWENAVEIVIEIAVAAIFFFITYYEMKKRPCIE